MSSRCFKLCNATFYNRNASLFAYGDVGLGLLEKALPLLLPMTVCGAYMGETLVHINLAVLSSFLSHMMSLGHCLIRTGYGLLSSLFNEQAEMFFTVVFIFSFLLAFYLFRLIIAIFFYLLESIWLSRRIVLFEGDDVEGVMVMLYVLSIFRMWMGLGDLVYISACGSDITDNGNHILCAK